MSNRYKCLSLHESQSGRYTLLPIRDQDKYLIMQWRNDQIEILRQKQPLTRELQEQYFRNVIASLFDAQKPDQLLFSFLEDGLLIGYGGLVHINWESRNAEVSFITETSRSRDPKLFVHDWGVYLTCLKDLVLKNNLFAKIYTYAYDMRPLLYQALKKSFFVQEARLKDHIVISGEYRDILIHSYFFDRLAFRLAGPDDVMLYFDWATDPVVRGNSFTKTDIKLAHHQEWFSRKLTSPDTVLLVAIKDREPVGQMRFDRYSQANYEIDFSLDKKYRSRNMGSLLLAGGTEEFFKRVPTARKVVGKVKPENFSSRRSFEKAGFEQSSDVNFDNIAVFQLDNPSL